MSRRKTTIATNVILLSVWHTEHKIWSGGNFFKQFVEYQVMSKTQLMPAYFIGTFFEILNTKLYVMKELLQRLSETKENTHDGFHIGGTIMVVLLFLAFMATSFYLMVTNY